MSSSGRVRAAMLACAAFFATAVSMAAEPPKAPPATAAAAQPAAADLLAAMAQYLAGLQGFEVRMAGGYDAVQPSGEKIEFLELRELAVARPARLSVRQISSDGAEDAIVFDGKTMSVFSSAAGVFAQAPQPGSLDDALLYFVRELGMNLPLAPMLSSRFPAELAKHLKSVEYVEYALLPRPAHHLAGRTDAVDFQVWVADGPQPVPLRIVITYRNEPAQPQFRAALVDWRFKAPDGDDAFRFEPPQGARQVAFAVQVPGVAAAAAKGAKP